MRSTVQLCSVTAPLRTLAGALLVLGASGCYHYVPQEPKSGEPIRATLTQVGRDTLTRSLGPEVYEITGTYLGREGDAVNLLVDGYASTRTGVHSIFNQSYTLPAESLEQIQVKQLNRTRSALFGAALAAGVVVAWTTLDIGDAFFGDGGTSGPDTVEGVARQPGLVLRIPFGAGR